jgi:predicted dehydrogenase
MSEHVGRRGFLKRAGSMGAGLAMAGRAFSANTPVTGRVVGANDRINVGLIGCGGRGTYVGKAFAKYGDQNNSHIVAVCDVYTKRRRLNAENHQAKAYADYREIIARPDIDAVIVATPDHWHAKIALEAMDKGKDVYLEKPMCHTNEEAKKLVDTMKETRRVVQVGSQTTSADQWWKAKKAVADGMIGKLIMSQGSYHRNSIEGEWNWPIDPAAGPNGKGDDYIDWETWLGPAPKRPWDADRFFRFRKYWDYSGGIATDLFFHVVAPLNICWDKPQFPTRVVASGGIYAFHDREVPDTFHLLAEYPEGHSLVLSSSMANSQHIPGLLRGHEGTLIMVEHGMFERYSPYLTMKPELVRPPNAEDRAERVPFPDYKFGKDEIKIPVEQSDMMQLHVNNFIACMRSREKPHLDVETAAHAQILINLAVESYRENKVRYWDAAKWKSVDHPVNV